MADPAVSDAWNPIVNLRDATRSGFKRRLTAPEAVRKDQARLLNLVAIRSLSADLTLTPWMDGASLTGRFSAEVVQTCGVTLEPFDARVEGEIDLKLVPEGSAAAPEIGAEVDLDPEADDPPEVLEGSDIDLGHYVFEHFALELDPFPRKPGAVFEAPAEPTNISPFAALANLKTRSTD